MRPGMAAIVAQLRINGQASRTDEFNEEAFWTDDQLEAIADACSERLLVKLVPVVSTLDIARTVFSLKTPRTYWFESDTMNTLQVSDDETLTIVTTTSSYSQVRGLLTFAEALSDRYEYAVEGYATNLNTALAALWEQKAAQRYDYVNFKAGNNKIDIEKEHLHCLAMMSLYRNRIMRRHERSGAGRWA